MLKKIGLVAAAATAAALAMGSVAFADEDEDGPLSGHVIQFPESYCDEDLLSGKLQIPEDEDSENNSDDDVECNQDVYPEED